MGRVKKRLYEQGMETEAEERGDLPSKSAKKRASAALRKLGEELAELSPERRAMLGLPDDLIEALAMLDKIRDNEGRRRQRQYIGKLMRGLDAEALERAMHERRF